MEFEKCSLWPLLYRWISRAWKELSGLLKVTLLVSGGNRRRTQDMWLSAVYFLCRWTKGDNSRGTLKSKNADVAKRNANPRDFGSGFQAKVLCAQRKALAPVHLCMLSCPLTQPRRKLHSLLRFPVCFSWWCSLCLQSLPASHMQQKPTCPWREPIQIPFTTKSYLISPLNPHHCSSHRWSSTTLNS